MNNNDIKTSLLEKLDQIKSEANPYNVKRMQLRRLEGCIKRIIAFSEDCMECSNFMNDINEVLDKLLDRSNPSEKEALKNYHLTLKKMISHLMKKHKLVTEGYHTELWMSLGMMFGLPFGIIFDNIAIGLPIGMAIGIGYGSGMDADAKKKGLVI